MSMFEALMSGLAAQTGIPQEQINTKGPVHLVFDEKTGVEINEDAINREICLSSKLSQIDNEEDMGAVALMLVHANFEQDQLGGAYLAMSEGGMVVLMRRIPMQSLSDSDLGKVLNEFVSTATQWSSSVAAMTKLLKENYMADDAGDSEAGIGMRV